MMNVSNKILESKNKLAIVTFVYNENIQLKRWVRYYSEQVQCKKCLYVIDHGSSDGSVDQFCDELNVIKLERSAGAENYQEWRVDFVSNLAGKLLNQFDYVVYVDSDEYLVVDPRSNLKLYEYVSEFESPVSHAIGFDVLHDYDNEPPLGDSKIADVRKYLQFVAAMCKPVLTSDKNVKWCQGFHKSNLPPRFGDLFLFHARYADLSEGLNRLLVTRQLKRPKYNGHVDHQTIEDETYKNWIKNWLRLPLRHDDVGLSCDQIKNYIKGFQFNKRQDGVFDFDYSLRSSEIFKIPDRFVGKF